jgi:hypothetical protein
MQRSIRKIKTVFLLSSIAMFTMSCVVLFCGWNVYRLGAQDTSKRKAAPSIRLDAEPSHPSKSDTIDLAIWNRRLSSFPTSNPMPIEESSVEVEPVEIQEPIIREPMDIAETFEIRLVGTVIEAGRSMAIAIDGQGKLDFRNEGEMLQLEPAGIQITKVSADAIRVTYQGVESNWQIGQPLTITQTNILDQKPIDMEEHVQPIQKKRKMTVEEELEMMNGNSPSTSF